MANTRGAGAQGKKTTQKKSAARNAKTRNARSAGQETGSRAGREVLGVALLCLGALTAYFLLTSPIRGLGKSIVDLSKGLAGGVSFAVPLLLWWAGAVVAFGSRERALRPGRVVLITLMALLALTLIHVFFVDDIMLTARVFDYGTFLHKSFEYRRGGAGLLGALLCWPLQRSLGTVGAVMVILFAMVAVLILLHKISLKRIGDRTRERAGEFHEQQRQMHQERVEQRRRMREEEAGLRIPRVQEDQMFVPTARRRGGMRIEKAGKETPLSMDPQIQALEGEDDYGEDLPDFLASRRRKRSTVEKFHVREPEPLPGFEGAAPMPTGDEIAEDPPAPRKPMEEALLEPDDDAPAPDDLSVFSELAESAPAEADDGPEDRIEANPLIDILPADEATVAPTTQPEKQRINPRNLPKAAIAPRETTMPGYVYPPIHLLAKSKAAKVANQEQGDHEKGKKLIETLASFGITARLIGIAHGPTVTRFEIAPAAGTKVSRITSLSDDIALNLAAVSVRIEAPIPGRAAVGVEVPNDTPETVPLRDVLESDACVRHNSRLAVALGKDNAGKPVICDLARMPHILIAGQTGSGKSVCINCIIASILYRATPEEVRMIMIDPKMVELSVYNGIPHLEVPVVTDPRKAAQALDWAVQEMTRRYKLFSQFKVHDLKGYNQRRPAEDPPLPQMVIIIDELADLMLVSPGEVEDSINRLAALARAAGIHLVIATQRPSVNVITGVIKANIPSRIAFTVASQVDSRTILDGAGAEKLLGRGDMLYVPSGKGKTRVQGAWISDEEVRAVVEAITDEGEVHYNEDAQEHIDNVDLSDKQRQDKFEEGDELLPQAIDLVVQAGQASVSMLQRRLRVGHSRAGRLIDEMEVRGIVGPDEGSKSRKVLITAEQLRQMDQNG